MTSLRYVTDGSLAVTALIAVGIIARSIQIILAGMASGEDIHDILAKVRKKIYAAILAICLSTVLGVIRRYYL
jgi:hypothetical protein